VLILARRFEDHVTAVTQIGNGIELSHRRRGAQCIGAAIPLARVLSTPVNPWIGVNGVKQAGGSIGLA
jgi:hypothetical protein